MRNRPRRACFGNLRSGRESLAPHWGPAGAGRSPYCPRAHPIIDDITNIAGRRVEFKGNCNLGSATPSSGSRSDGLPMAFSAGSFQGQPFIRLWPSCDRSGATDTATATTAITLAVCHRCDDLFHVVAIRPAASAYLRSTLSDIRDMSIRNRSMAAPRRSSVRSVRTLNQRAGSGQW